MTQAQMEAGPAIFAAFHAPNSQPDPMMEPRPVSISANGPMFRCIELFTSSPVSEPCRHHVTSLVALETGDAHACATGPILDRCNRCAARSLTVAPLYCSETKGCPQEISG